VYVLFKGTRGAAVLTGLATILLIMTFVSVMLQLEVISAILKGFSAFLALALVIIFQPELRLVLADLGSRHFFNSSSQKREVIEVIVEAATNLASKKIGALLAIEREVGIRGHAETGVAIDCVATPELLETIFYPNTPLHDGGVVIRNDRIISAACIFPITHRAELNRLLGMRHRAAIGLSEETDAIVVTVSEETGTISICVRGEITRDLGADDLRDQLANLLFSKNARPTNSGQSFGEKGSIEEIPDDGNTSGKI